MRNELIDFKCVITSDILLRSIDEKGADILETNVYGDLFKIIARAVTKEEPFKIIRIESDAYDLKDIPSKFQFIKKIMYDYACENINEKGSSFTSVCIPIKI